MTDRMKGTAERDISRWRERGVEGYRTNSSAAAVHSFGDQGGTGHGARAAAATAAAAEAAAAVAAAAAAPRPCP